MRSSWVAMGSGLGLAVVLAVTRPAPDGSGPLFASDPNARMDQLINQSESRYPIGHDPRPWWQQAWELVVPPPPSHLTPERLHGGIM